MKQVYLNEYNLEADNSVFLPYSTGLLSAYAQQHDQINTKYEFKPIIFRKDTVKNIVDQYDNPSIVGFSTVVWNYRLSLAVAKELKKKFPDCLIVFGGPAVENNKKILNQHTYIDIAVYGEGERRFHDILVNRLYHSKFWIPSGTLISSKAVEYTHLDLFPSPYTSGVYDQILQDNPNIEFKALVECNRNCPFGCDYCFWGQPELEKKIKYHSPEYIKQDAEWIAKRKIDYVFCTDANFGMFNRDIETAKTYVIAKQNYGYPEKFRVCYGKNAADSIFEAASVLNSAGMDKLITLSVQSTNPDTLKAVNRININQDVFKQLQKRYLDNNIATYTEFILGLPCETKQSFYDGLEQTLRTIQHNQIFVYPCLVLPNTKLASKEYREKYGLITRTLPMKVPHSNVVNPEWVPEYDEIVIGTNAMSIEDWKECSLMSWVVQLFHSLNVGYNIIDYIYKTYHFSYMEIYQKIADSNIDEICELRVLTDHIINGEHWSMTYPDYGNMYYEPEEMMYLHILYNPTKFYTQLFHTLRTMCPSKYRVGYDGTLDLLIHQQRQQLPNTDNVTDWAEFAVNTIIRGGKDNKEEPINV